MTYATRNTLPEPIRGASVARLNRLLGSSIDLQAQLKHAHWNVRGIGFIAVHELFDDIAEDVGEWSDQLAERAAALGGTAFGTLKAATGRSQLVDYPLNVASTKDHLFAVAGALAAFGQTVRTAIDEATSDGDADTADVFTSISRACDQRLWLVEAHRDPGQVRLHGIQSYLSTLPLDFGQSGVFHQLGKVPVV